MSTIKDIARYVGVSTATVSNALNGRANVSEDMRRRIMEAAEQMNYIPNISAKLMRGHKTKSGFSCPISPPTSTSASSRRSTPAA